MVMVCTGNRFRSPLAEAFVRQLTPELPVRVSSLGLLDLGRRRPLHQALALAPQYGVNLMGHRSNLMTEGVLADTDLVVGFERFHVAESVTEGRADPARSFTLQELAELLRAVPSSDLTEPLERARRMITAAHELRLGPRPVAVVDLPDPLGGSAESFRRTADDLHRLCTMLVTQLFRDQSLARCALHEVVP